MKMFTKTCHGQLSRPSFFMLWKLELKGQAHQDLVLLENPMKVLVIIGIPLIVA